MVPETVGASAVGMEFVERLVRLCCGVVIKYKEDAERRKTRREEALESLRRTKHLFFCCENFVS